VNPVQASSHAEGGVRSAVSNAADGVSSFGRCALASRAYRWTPENLRCTICVRDVDSVEEMRSGSVEATAALATWQAAGPVGPLDHGHLRPHASEVWGSGQPGRPGPRGAGPQWWGRGPRCHVDQGRRGARRGYCGVGVRVAASVLRCGAVGGVRNV